MREGSRDRYSTKHPLYAHIRDLSKVRAKHPALADGAQVQRHAADGAGIVLAAEPEGIVRWSGKRACRELGQRLRGAVVVSAVLVPRPPPASRSPHAATQLLQHGLPRERFAPVQPTP